MELLRRLLLSGEFNTKFYLNSITDLLVQPGAGIGLVLVSCLEGQ